MLQCFDFGKISPVHTRQEAGWASLPILMQWYEKESQLISIYLVCHKSHSLAEQSYFMCTQHVPTMLFVSLFTIVFGTAKNKNSHSAITYMTWMCYVFKSAGIWNVWSSPASVIFWGAIISINMKEQDHILFQENRNVSWNDNPNWLRLYVNTTSVYSENTSLNSIKTVLFILVTNIQQMNVATLSH